MTKSMHYVVGYNHLLGNNLRIFVEAHYQNLFNVPVEIKTSSFSMLNQGVGYSRFFPDSLQNTGTGQNYGGELTIEKFFSRKFFFMMTTSLYQSYYVGSDNVKRNTDFNGNYIFNFLGAKEFVTKKKNSFTLGTKYTFAGNKRYGPVDLEASKIAQEVVYLDSERNSKQFAPYSRWDIKLNYKINRIKVSHEIAIDLVNILGKENILNLTYAPNLNDPTADPILQQYQLGFLPVFYYRINL